MKFKLDENLGTRGAEIFRQAGYDAASVWEEGLSSAADRTIIAACKDEARCLVTLDLEFGNPLLFKPSDHAGIAVIRQPREATPDDLFGAIETLISGLTDADITGKLWVVRRGQIREYQPDEDP